MSGTLAQKHEPLEQRKTESQRYFDQKLRMTNAQRNACSLSKTSFSPKRVNRDRVASMSHPRGTRPKHVSGLSGPWRHRNRRGGALPHRSVADQIRREE